MSSDSTIVSFGSVVEFISTKAPAKDALHETYISTANMQPNFGGIEKASSLPLNGGVSRFEPGDTLFSNIRTYFKKVWQADFSGHCSNDVLVFRTKDIRTLLPDYLYNLCRWETFTEYSVRTSKGAKMPRGDKEALAQFELSLPPLAEQSSVVSILNSLDRRITLLRETNKTLESIAQTIFKSWFVDFDPVRAKMEGRQPEGMDEETAALFPDSFEDSELGAIPKSWQVCSVEDFALRVGMGPFGSNIKVETFVESGVPIISGQHLKQLLVEDNSFNFITREHAQRLAKSCVEAGDVIFTHAGSIGQVSLLHKDAAYSSYVLSQRQFFLRCNEELVSPEWAVLYFKSTAGQHQLLANTSQVGVPSIARPVSYLRSIRMVIPPTELNRRFASIVRSINNCVMSNRKQHSSLSRVRDTLLPRLISGQLRLPDVQEQVEDTLS